MAADPRSLLRFAGSSAVACVVVVAILIASLWAFGFLDRPRGHHAVDVLPLTKSERLDLAEALGERPVDRRPRLPPLEEIPPLEIPRHQETGFVQVEFSVDAEGRVTDAEVIRAVPEGVFETQALEIVRSRQYAPGESGRLTELVEFSVGSDKD